MDSRALIKMLLHIDVPSLSLFYTKRELYRDNVIRTPLVLRLDGVRFGRLLIDYEFRSIEVHNALTKAAKYIMRELGCECSYVISDEINVVCINYIAYRGRIEKLNSISSGIASSIVSLALNRPLFFDSRVIKFYNDMETARYILYRARIGFNNFVSELYHRITKRKYTPTLNKMIEELREVDIDILAFELWKILGSSVVKEFRLRSSGRRGWDFNTYDGYLKAIECIISNLVLG